MPRTLRNRPQKHSLSVPLDESTSALPGNRMLLMRGKVGELPYELWGTLPGAMMVIVEIANRRFTLTGQDVVRAIFEQLIDKETV